MAKNIIILFDGTSNQISADRTNIVRLLGCLQRSDAQLVYYDPGVGTFGGDDSWFRYKSKLSEFWGQVTGWGLDQNVKDAYRFLVENYTPPSHEGADDGDRIFLFGFSRGAYSARVLAGFINSLGLIAPQFLNLVDYAYRTYKDIPLSEQHGESAESQSKPAASAFASMRLYERTLRGKRPPIAFLGLFDTVNSVINQTSKGITDQTFPFTSRNPSVAAVRHALCIDEHRSTFRPVYWTLGQSFWGGPFKPKNPDAIKPQNIKEVWFAGVHDDVGGGYPEAQSQLAKIPLAWMIHESEGFGALYDQRAVNNVVYGRDARHHYVAPDALGDMHDSVTAQWKPFEYIPRSIPWSSWRCHGQRGMYLPRRDPRWMGDHPTIHQSVVDRLNGHPQQGPYAPVNLPSTYAIEPWTKTDE